MNNTDKREQTANRWDQVAESTGREDAFYERVLALYPTYEGKLLDIACGPGHLLEKVRKASPRAELYGIDISPRLCEMAKKRNPEAVIAVGDAASLPYADSMFDIVFMTETLAHVSDPVRVLSEARRVLVPNGVFIITVPNRDWLRYDFYERLIKKVPGGTHYFRFAEIQSLLTHAGFRISTYRGSDNLYYYAPYHKYEQMLAFFFPFLHRKMKRLLFKCTKA